MNAKITHKWMRPRSQLLEACVAVAIENDVHPDNWRTEASEAWTFARTYLRTSWRPPQPSSAEFQKSQARIQTRFINDMLRELEARVS